MKNRLGFCRFAVSINGKVANSVQRNYMKRVTREWFRARQLRLTENVDLWLSVKKRFDRRDRSVAEAAFDAALASLAGPRGGK